MKTYTVLEIENYGIRTSPRGAEKKYGEKYAKIRKKHAALLDERFLHMFANIRAIGPDYTPNAKEREIMEFYSHFTFELIDHFYTIDKNDTILKSMADKGYFYCQQYYAEKMYWQHQREQGEYYWNLAMNNPYASPNQIQRAKERMAVYKPKKMPLPQNSAAR
ncbi:MAG: hypothetical protein LBU87_01485 [Lactobacillales bacterium]|jgi:flavorubredoxin|nr:hypothetical protein [Lactobacillales bacterium]